MIDFEFDGGTKISFNDITIGDMFRCDGDYFIKISLEEAWNISSRYQAEFGYTELVEPIDVTIRYHYSYK